MSRRIYFFKDYLIERFGHPLYRIPINLALGCPHKSRLSSGCIFCSEDGGLAIHLQRDLKIGEQITEGIKYIQKRYDSTASEYIAYLQAYTNTYADIEKLKNMYEEILSSANFKLLIIATRPDCLSEEILNYLSELNKRIELWVELGIQSSNDLTLKTVNRGHNFECAERAAKALSNLGIKIVAHLIIGLPNETIDDYITTIKRVVALPLAGIKLHNLLILKDSELGKLYSKESRIQDNNILLDTVGKIPLFNEYEYINIISTLLRLVPPHIPILRLTADAPDNKILSPKWNSTKGRIIELLQEIMLQNNCTQGDLIDKQLSNSANNTLAENTLRVKTADNSFTFYNQVYKECYHSQAGASSEAYYKFILPSEIPLRLEKKSSLAILDIGFGLGYNVFAALKEAAHYHPSASLNITSLESDPKSLSLALSLYNVNSLEYNILSALRDKRNWSCENSSVDLIMGDARKTLSGLQKKFDLIFLDAFSTNKNPELWTFDFIKALKKVLQEDGAIVTYSAAFPVRGALVRNNFFVGATPPFGRKNGGTIAALNPNKIKIELSEKEKNIILKSTAGVPFRDPTFSLNFKEIIELRDKIVKKLKKKGVPKWFFPK